LKKIFFDTWGWVAIANADDIRHQEVTSFYKEFLDKNGTPMTTDYILSETITLLRSRTGTEGTAIFVDTLLEAANAGRIELERITPERWNKAWNLCKKYKDKGDISFVDFTSFVVMRETGVLDVLTADRHFNEVGLKFRKIF
jgi:predicted nucleic acid-binding protein